MILRTFYIFVCFVDSAEDFTLAEVVALLIRERQSDCEVVSVFIDRDQSHILDVLDLLGLICLDLHMSVDTLA